MEQRHGYFAPFTPPPEWCIDKGPGGNKTFFEEEWGKPPERIGRDPRYRPLAPEPRFGSFEPQAPMSRGIIRTRKLAQPMDGRFYFGA